MLLAFGPSMKHESFLKHEPATSSEENACTDREPSPTVFTLLNSDLYPKAQEVEIASSLQIPTFQIIGLPGPEVSEAKDRVRSAIEATEIDFPRRKIVLNLSPASVRKKGTGLDLAMAIAVLIEGMRIEGRKASRFPNRRIFAWGELGLTGNVKPVGAPARAIASALEGGAECLFVARAEEERFLEILERLFPESIDQIQIFGVDHLSEVLRYLRDGEIPRSGSARAPRKALEDIRKESPSLLPLPRSIERTLRIAASGAHHFLLLGPKGAGKSHALEWFLFLQPELDQDTLRMRNFLGEISGKSAEAPFRRVGTQARPASLLGSYSGGLLRPGELSLAHGGVLLADEFPEWSRDAREALREPLERRKLSLTRVDGAVELPSDFVFAGNGNLCPCGGIPEAPTLEEDFACRCLPVDRNRYLARMSGPILDRLDLVSVIRKRPEAESGRSAAEEMVRLREEVSKARRLLISEYGNLPGKMESAQIESILRANEELRIALDGISFRSFRDRHKTLRIALTLAALQGRPRPDTLTLLEARALRTQADTIFHPA